MKRVCRLLLIAFTAAISQLIVPGFASDSTWVEHYRAGLYALKCGDKQAATAEFQKSLAEIEASPSAGREKGLSLYRLGSMEAESGDLEKAVGTLEQALNIQAGALFAQHPDILQTVDALLDSYRQLLKKDKRTVSNVAMNAEGLKSKIESLSQQKNRIETQLFDTPAQDGDKSRAANENAQSEKRSLEKTVRLAHAPQTRVGQNSEPDASTGLARIVERQAASDGYSTGSVAQLMEGARRAQLKEDVAGAESLFNKALSHQEKASGANSAQVLDCLMPMAKFYIAQRNFKRAYQLIVRVENISRICQSPQYAVSHLYANLGSVSKRQSDFTTSEAAFKRALNLMHGEDLAEEYLSCAFQLASLYLERHRAGEIPPLLEPALRKPTAEDSSKTRLYAYFTLAEAYRVERKWAKAEQVLKTTESYCRANGMNNDLAECHHVMAVLHGTQGLFAAADADMLRALAVATDDSQRSVFLLARGQVLMNLKKYSMADKVLRESLKVGGPTMTPNYQYQLYTSLASVSQTLGNTSDGKTFNRKAHELEN